MQAVTSSIVSRTAHEYIKSTDALSFGAGLLHGINQVCRCCKSTDTRQLHGEELRPWSEFYTTLEFKAYRCNVCDYPFSWYKGKQNETKY